MEEPLIKINVDRLEAHDRLIHVNDDQSIKIFQGAEDCLKRNELSKMIQEKSPYIYIFAHPRKSDDSYKTRLLWQPRLSKPEAQTNSYLFRAISKSDNIEVCWLIPPKSQWKEYTKGKVTESDIVTWSINQYRHNRHKLEEPHPEDLPEQKGRLILKSIVDEHLQKIRSKPMTLEPYDQQSSQLPNKKTPMNQIIL